MKILNIISFILVFHLISACEKSHDSTWMYYEETYCSDPWEKIGPTDEERKQEIAKYLQSKGVDVLEIKITSEGNQQHCYACHCTTGELIKCEILNKDITKLQTLGFYQ